MRRTGNTETPNRGDEGQRKGRFTGKGGRQDLIGNEDQTWGQGPVNGQSDRRIVND